MPKFVKDFLDIYVTEKDIKQSFGDEYVERFSNVDSETGKKKTRKISVSKLTARIIGTSVFIYFLFMFIRLVKVWYI